MSDLQAIDQIRNPATGEWVKITTPTIIQSGDVDSFIAGYQRRLVDEWNEQHPLPARADELARKLQAIRESRIAFDDEVRPVLLHAELLLREVAVELAKAPVDN